MHKGEPVVLFGDKCNSPVENCIGVIWVDLQRFIKIFDGAVNFTQICIRAAAVCEEDLV